MTKPDVDQMDARTAEFTAGSRRAARLGYSVLALFGGTFGLWAAVAPLSGAVVSQAQFVAETNIKKVQHPTGGIVKDLLVRDGDSVKAGDVVIRLDDTIARANVAMLSKQLDAFYARLARLEAERDDADNLKSPDEFRNRSGAADVTQLMEGEMRLFTARRDARAGVKAQLRTRIAQLRNEIVGLRQQHSARIREATMIDRELVGVRQLYDKNLVQIMRLSQLEREAASLEGNAGQLTAQIAQSEGKIAEAELQIIQVTEDLRAEAMKEIREIQAKVAELLERRIAAEDQLERIEIRAPVGGYVHQLAVHTVGGVIANGEPAMLVMPASDRLELEAQVLPQDIDQVYMGQKSVVRVNAGNQRTTPELNGTVTRISADVVRVQQTGATFYVVRVSVPKDEVQKLGELKIMAGMQATVFLQTEPRTFFSYLARPLYEQTTRAFRER